MGEIDAVEGAFLLGFLLGAVCWEVCRRLSARIGRLSARIARRRAADRLESLRQHFANRKFETSRPEPKIYHSEETR